VILYRIRHPGTLKYLYFDSKEEAERFYEGFNPIVMIVCEIKHEEAIE